MGTGRRHLLPRGGDRRSGALIARLRPKERGRDDGYSIFAAVSGGAAGDDGGVEQLVAELVRQPVQVPDVVVADRAVEL